MAIIISRKNLTYINYKKNLITKKSATKEKKLQILSEKIKKMELAIYSDVTIKGRLFGSITPKDISKHLQNHEIHISYKQIIIKYPIKYIGYHQVKIILDTNTTAMLNINVMN